MGRILHKKFKRYAEDILKIYKPLFSDNFEKNKKIVEAIADLPSKKIRNLIAGYITRQIKKEKTNS